jgi:hypothetical protein
MIRFTDCILVRHAAIPSDNTFVAFTESGIAWTKKSILGAPPSAEFGNLNGQ